MARSHTIWQEEIVNTLNRFLNIALQAAREGYPAFPLWPRKKTPIHDGGFKIATRNEDQIRAWWKEHPRANIGVPTGQVSGISVVDIDGHNGNESIRQTFGSLPETRLQGSPHGNHAIYKYDPRFHNRNAILPNVDIKSDGGYLVWAGSVVDCDKPDRCTNHDPEYKVIRDIQPISFGEVPEVFQNQKGNRDTKNLVNSDGSLSVGERNGTLTSLAGSMRNAGFGTDAIKVALLAHNEEFCVPPLEEEEIRKIAKQAKGWKRGKNQAKDKVWIPEITNLGTVEPEFVEWRWKGRLPKGKIVIIQGDPEQGKSFLTQEIIARYTRGEPIYPDKEKVSPANVLLLSGEDGMADTIVPRLVSMNADLSRVDSINLMRADEDVRGLSLTEDLAVMEQMLKEKQYGLVVIDPISAYTPNTDTNTDNRVRSMLMPLKDLAEQYGVTIIIVRHLTKNEQTKTAYRGQGSIAYEAAARVVMLVGKNPDNEEERILAVTKLSVDRRPPSLAFTLTTDETTGGASVTWIGETEVTAEQLLTSRSGEEKSAMEEAEEFILDMLKSGDKLQRECINLAKDNGFSETTINRAKRKLRIRSVKPAGKQHEPWYWNLPAGKGGQGGQEIVDHVDHVEGKLGWTGEEMLI